jgi:putative endonuclease
MEAHREGYVSGFTSKYRLVYYEVCEGGAVATARQRQLKKWNRARNISLIEAANPSWRDLAYDVLTG